MNEGTTGGRRFALAIGAVILLLAGGAFWFLRSLDPGGDALRIAPTTAAATREATPATATNEAPKLTAERLIEPPAPAPLAPGVRPPPESYTRELAGLRGRLVEADGTPVPEKKVELLRIHPDLLATVYQGGFEPPPAELIDFRIDEAKSDAKGIFVLTKAQSGALTLLGIDLGGPRGTVRFLDVALERGQTCDLGDIVLPPHVTFTGTVLDEEGAPLAGARVRVIPQLPMPIPPQVLEVGVQDVRSDCAALVSSKDEGSGQLLRAVVEMPGWFKSGFDRLPLPTTTTEADGRFRLPGIPAGLVTLLVDRHGALGMVRAGLPTGRREEQDVGKLRLSSGRTVTGRALAGTTPVAGARLFVGAAMPIPVAPDAGIFALGQPAGPTDADGRFSLSGLPNNGDLLVAIEPRAGDPWTLLGPFDHDEVALALPARAALTVLVVGPDGKPVDHAELRFIEGTVMAQMPPILSPPLQLRGRIREEPEGRYVVDELPVGKWRVVARAPGFGASHAEVELPPAGAEVSVALQPARSISAHVVEAAGGAPVDYALVTALMHMDGFLDLPYASARSDALGAATLTGLPTTVKMLLRVTHPGFAPFSVPIEAGPTAAAPIEVALLRGGDLVGRVTTGGEPPTKTLMLVLDKRGRNDLPEEELPRFAITAADGSFKVRHLGAGEWNWKVFPRFLFADPLDLAKSAMNEPDELANGQCQIEEGKETPLAIEALPEGDLVPATLRGRVRVDGATRAGLEVRAMGRRFRRAETDEAGHYELTDLRPGDYTIEVRQTDDESRTTLHQSQLTLGPADVRELDIDARTVPTLLLVRTSNGEPVDGASVRVAAVRGPSDSGGFLGSASGTTGKDGRVTLSLRGGKWKADAAHDERGRGSATFEIGDHDALRSEPIEILLDPGVVVAGRIEFDGAPPTDGDWYLSLQPVRNEKDGGPDFTGGSWTEVKPADRRFEYKTVVPGRYQAQFWSSGDNSPNLRSEEFVVGPNGERDLLLHLKPQ